TLLPNDIFLTWGWRIPFVASLVLVVLGLWIRIGLEETPDFSETKKQGNISSLPISDTLKHHWKDVLLTEGGKATARPLVYMFATFAITEGKNMLNTRENPVLTAIRRGTRGSILVIPCAGKLAHRIGTRTVFLGGTVAVMLFII